MARPSRPCDDRGVPRESQTAGQLARLVAAVFLIAGIAAMHHLVLSGCSAAMAQPAAAHELSNDPHLEQGQPASETDHGSSTPSDDAERQMACLGLLIGLWLMTPMARSWRLRRSADEHGTGSSTAASVTPSRPPDRILLSVNRR